MPTVLLLDSDEVARQTLAYILAPRFRTIDAATIEKAIQQIIIHRPQIIVLECNLPDGDAFTFVRQLRSDAFMRQAIIVFVTSCSTIKDKVAGFQAGADDYVVKPVNTETFVYRLLLLQRLPRSVA